jgi:hypothetical protein
MLKKLLSTACTRYVTVAGMLLTASFASLAQLSFSHKDWEIACDNTRTCRAAGYQIEADIDKPASILLTRKAGPGFAVQAQLQLGGDDLPKAAIRLKAGSYATEVAGTELSALQVTSLLPVLLKTNEMQLSSGKLSWKISTEGLNAVLLKMDEFQGRLGTPGALVRKGTRAESSVLAAIPAPVVKAAQVVATKPQDAALGKLIFAGIDKKAFAEECGESNARNLEIVRLTQSKVLLSMGCGLGAYNYTWKLWIANDKPPYAPQMQEANGEFDASSGEVNFGNKGRGIGDCWSHEQWVFNGKDFTSSGESTTGMCRGFAGGAWDLPTYVTTGFKPSKK